MSTFFILHGSCVHHFLVWMQALAARFNFLPPPNSPWQPVCVCTEALKLRGHHLHTYSKQALRLNRSIYLLPWGNVAYSQVQLMMEKNAKTRWGRKAHSEFSLDRPQASHQSTLKGINTYFSYTTLHTMWNSIFIGSILSSLVAVMGLVLLIYW